MQVILKLKGASGKRFALPPQIEKRIINAMKRNRLGVGMDYDNTMVNTDDVARKFFAITKDKSRVIEPMGALGMLGIPVGVFTGNKSSYINMLCANPYRGWLLERGKVETMLRFRTYSQNSAWLQVFDENGAVIPETSKEYGKAYLFPKEHINMFRSVFRGPIQKAMPKNFMRRKPIEIRPSGSTDERHYAFGPLFENRDSVMVSWIAIHEKKPKKEPEKTRKEIIEMAIKNLNEDIRAAYRIEPGGGHSIDISHVHVEKNIGTVHFRKDMGIWRLAYFGDSVYKRRERVGNDLPVIKDPNAVVFAVNKNQDEVPENDRVIKAGVGPNATRDWLTWLAVKYIDVRFDAAKLTNQEKTRMVDAIVMSGLIENVEIR